MRRFLQWRSRRCDPARRSERAAARTPAVFRRRRRRHPHDVQLLRQPAPVLRAGVRRRRAARRRAATRPRRFPHTAQWAQFLRNHDELDLGRLTRGAARSGLRSASVPSRTCSCIDRGIRRRLAPMLGDRRNIELAYSMLFALPGAPVIRYGDEIGMGENLALPEREAVRTPMQWAASATAASRPAQAAAESGDHRRASTATSRSTSRRSGAIRTRCSTGWCG